MVRGRLRKLWSAALRGGKIETDDAEKAKVFNAFLSEDSLQKTSATICPAQIAQVTEY